MRGFLRLQEMEQLPLHAPADRLGSSSKQQHIKRSFDAQYGCIEGQVRQRVAPCSQQGFWEILPAFRAGEIYSLLSVWDRCRGWETGESCSFIWDEKSPTCCAEGGVCSGGSVVWVGPHGRLFMSMKWWIDNYSSLVPGICFIAVII